MKLKKEKLMKIQSGLLELVKKCRIMNTLYTKLKKMYLNSVEKTNSIHQKELRLLLYSDIDSFPLLKFIDCLCDKNYHSLYKETSQIPLPGIRDEKLEIEVFDELYIEFLDRFFENDQSIFENKKKMMLLYSKICVLENIEFFYFDLKSEPIVLTVLRKYGVRLTDNDNTNLTIIAGVKETLIRKYKAVIQKIKESNPDVEGEDNVHGWERKTFIDIVSSLSNYLDRQISISLLTVGEYCSLYQFMKKSLKKTPKQNYYGKRIN